MKNTISLRQGSGLALLVAAAGFAAACATTTPIELENARVAYSRASAGPAAQYTPADLHKAKAALDKAEQNFSYGNDAQTTIDLAYIAERTAQIAEAHAVSAIADQKDGKAKQELGQAQTKIITNTQATLVKTREQLTEAERGQALQAEQAGNERLARDAAEKKAAASEQKAAVSDQKAQEANDALAKLAAKDDERGMIITLSGSVLFRSNDTALLPASLTRLDQVATALVAKGNDVVVEGYTDSRGSQSRNMTLSQGRAESVRMYLVSRGFPAERISARGMGPDRPIAENTTSEGRANNRRVEIVITKSAPRLN
jgi:outer membrane protein OmpA-like peptidoglycan-associated protein